VRFFRCFVAAGCLSRTGIEVASITDMMAPATKAPDLYGEGLDDAGLYGGRLGHRAGQR
jgi:hypothetical protein